MAFDVAEISVFVKAMLGNDPDDDKGVNFEVNDTMFLEYLKMAVDVYSSGIPGRGRIAIIPTSSIKRYLFPIGSVPGFSDLIDIQFTRRNFNDFRGDRTPNNPFLLTNAIVIPGFAVDYEAYLQQRSYSLKIFGSEPEWYSQWEVDQAGIVTLESFTGTFLPQMFVEGSGSGATASISAVNGLDLILQGVIGTFLPGETITGETTFNGETTVATGEICKFVSSGSTRVHAVYIDLPSHFLEDSQWKVSMEFVFKYGATDDKFNGLLAIPDAHQSWVKNYTLALTKQGLGRIRDKFKGIQGPDGTTLEMDGFDLISESTTEILDLRARLDAMKRPVDIIIN